MSDINPGQLSETINWKADRDLKNLNNQGISFVVRPGMVVIWAGTTVPEGYLLCDGSAVSRTTYSALFSAIGTTYGQGDSSSTFNLPNIKPNFGSTAPTVGNKKALGIIGSNNITYDGYSGSI